MDDKRRPIVWEITVPHESLWDELETWAEENNVTIEKLIPKGSAGVFDPSYHIVHRLRLSCWDRNVAIMGKLRWGGLTE